MGTPAGGRAERAAARHLARRGWRIVARNWHGPGGELDLVAVRGPVAALIEVKLRADPGAFAEPVRAAQRERVRRTAELFLARHPEHARPQTRLDLVLVRRLGPWHRVRHLPHGAE